MKLQKEQREALTRALAAAFPSSNDLDQLTQFKLGQRLESITAPAPHLTLVLRVVNWVESRDALFPALIAGALNQNPENSDLQQVARDFGLDEGAGEFEARVFQEIPVTDVEDWRGTMMRCERAVCRIELDGKANGTGFLVGPQQVLTNYHVVHSVIGNPSGAQKVVARFDFKLQSGGKTVQDGVPYQLQPGKAWLEASSPIAELDYALLRLARKAAGEPIAGQPGAPERGFLRPEPWTFRNAQPLFIIQHPDGSPLKFAAGSVTDAAVRPNRVAHNATTQPGSSGSPAFTSDWKLVGLHHWGGADHNRVVSMPAVAAKLEEQGIRIGQ
jgi:V8-like Glu-specific endopeptidase